MKYTTLEYDLNKPAPKQVTVPLDSDYGLAVKVIKDGEQVQLSAGQMTIDGIQEAGVRDGWLQYELSSGSTPCTLEKQFEIKTGEASPLSGFDENSEYHVIGTRITVSRPAKLPSSMAVSPSEIQEWYAECQLSGDAGMLSTWTTSYENNSNFLVTIGRDSYFVNNDGLWQKTTGSVTKEQLTFTSNQPMKTLIDTASMPLSSYLQVRFVMNSRPAPDPICLDLAVQEKDLGYFEIPDLRPEPEPEPPTVVISGWTLEPAEPETVTKTIQAIIDGDWNGQVKASDVVSFTCTTKIEGEDPVVHDDFMNVNVQDDVDYAYWFVKPGDPEYGQEWYEAEGGSSMTAETIKIVSENNFRLLNFEQPEGKSVEVTFELKFKVHEE